MRMRGLTLGFILTVLAGQAWAQSVRFGLEGGLSVANLTGNVASYYGSSVSSHIGILGGVFLQVNLGPSFAIQPEILYSQEGTDISVLGVTGSLDLSYVEIPLLLKLYLPTPTVKPNLFAGAAVGFNSVAQVSAGGASVPITGVNSTETSVIGGVGLDIDKFSVSGRYQQGLSNIGTTNVQNGVFSVLVGFSFI